MRIELEITDGITSKTKTFKEGTTIERAEEVMELMWMEDWRGNTYRLYVDDQLYSELES